MIASQSNIAARMNFGASLPNNDAAGQHKLPAEALYSQPFAFGIAAVPGTASGFFCGHFFSS
jgi:hypothetical protein